MRRLIRPSVRALRRHTCFLAEACHPRDHAHVENMRRAAEYVHRHLVGVCDQAALQEFDVGGNTYANVAGRLGPVDGPRIVVGAHYDSCGSQPGADDNASGVAGLLELARVLAGEPPRLRVDLVAYALEEPPHFGTPDMGSAHHARALQQEGAEVRAMICLEMIGYFTDEPKSQRYPFPALDLLFPSVGNFIAVCGRLGESRLVHRVAHSMARGAAELPVHAVALPAWVSGVSWSDHRSYWEAGFPAVMVTDTSLFRNPHMHTDADVPDTLDFARMAHVVRGVAEAVRDLGN